MSRSFFGCLLPLVFLLASCGKDNHCGVPYGDGAIVDLSLPEMNALNTIGGALTINRGHKGIYIVHSTLDKYLAFECACPKDHETAVTPIDGWGSSVLQCPVCGSVFSVYADGSPIEGSATPCSLFQYSVVFDGYYLNIY